MVPVSSILFVPCLCCGLVSVDSTARFLLFVARLRLSLISADDAGVLSAFVA